MDRGRRGGKNFFKVCARFAEQIKAVKVRRQFSPGEKYLFCSLLPAPHFQAIFVGPYDVKQRVNNENYVIKTPDRRKKKILCT